MSTNYFTANVSKVTPKIISSHRVLVTSATRPSLQSKKDKEVTETCEKTKEAAEAVEQGAKEVRETCEFMRDTVETTAEKFHSSKIVPKSKPQISVSLSNPQMSLTQYLQIKIPKSTTMITDAMKEREILVDDDLKFLLENDDSIRVEEIVKNYSDELYAILRYMELQLEELLDIVMSKCRIAHVYKHLKQQLACFLLDVSNVSVVVLALNALIGYSLFGSFAFFQHVGLVGQGSFIKFYIPTPLRNVEMAVEEGPSKATADDNLHDGVVANEEEEGCEQGRPSSFTDFIEPPEDGDVEGDGMENATNLEYMGWKDIKKEKGDDLLCEMRF
ncbi:hypothetical protein FNV43_RR02271 [Rhamnella rubrinervis]|uniref:Uncharacterized protein n=1 Tax=Rhamnella rubrinervis TaxID=2594499 RepID=A0A8K0MTN1_9ROSA|nr:hypothetical protein FNV43_RR02271 [Rhamnella rubrinervis]